MANKPFDLNNFTFRKHFENIIIKSIEKQFRGQYRMSIFEQFGCYGIPNPTEGFFSIETNELLLFETIYVALPKSINLLWYYGMVCAVVFLNPPIFNLFLLTGPQCNFLSNTISELLLKSYM